MDEPNSDKPSLPTFGHRPAGGYRYRPIWCSECAVRPREDGSSLCRRCIEREQREQ